MGGRARLEIHVGMGTRIQASAGVSRSRTSPPERRNAAGALRQRDVHVRGLRVLSPTPRRRPGSFPIVREFNQPGKIETLRRADFEPARNFSSANSSVL